MKRNSQFCDLDNADSANHEEIANGLPRLKRFCNWIVVVFLLVGSAVYTAHFLPRSWAPEDEGTLAQPALRVLEGQLPHRDFDDVYTGGEAFLNAAAFRIFGIRLISMRYMLYCFFLAWVGAFYYAASRFVSSPIAAALTALATVWSVPNYPAAMPSWYTMFFATFGIAAILRYIATLRCRCLFVAGLCAGCSLIIKVSGLYFIAAAFLFFLFRCQRASGEMPETSQGDKRCTVLVWTAVLIFEVLLLRLCLKSGGVAAIGYFFLPGLAVGAGALFGKESQQSHSLRLFIFEFVPFMLGLIVPVALFLTLYDPHGWRDLARGVFVLPQKRFAYATFRISKLRFFGGVAADITLIAALLWKPTKLSRWRQTIFLLSLPLVLYLARVIDNVFRVTWSLCWCLLPIVTVFGALWIMDARSQTCTDKTEKQKQVLLLATLANCSLIQFPYSSAEYFLYVAPLLVLAVGALLSRLDLPPRLVWGSFAFFFLFMVMDCTPGWILSLGDVFHHDEQNTELSIPIAHGLRSDPATVATYERLGHIVQSHARGRYILATPDCPEVYVLYGYENPTRTLWDFTDDPTNRTQRILRTIEEHNINLVVFRRLPFSSGEVQSDLRSAVERQFPHQEQVWLFDVRWRD